MQQLLQSVLGPDLPRLFGIQLRDQVEHDLR
jgi:hypothetical protein